MSFFKQWNDETDGKRKMNYPFQGIHLGMFMIFLTEEKLTNDNEYISVPQLHVVLLVNWMSPTGFVPGLTGSYMTESALWTKSYSLSLYTSLPLCRPCAMVVPDFELICEIMLVAEGFLDARVLARKFITLYTLCKELLSKQVQYASDPWSYALAPLQPGPLSVCAGLWQDNDHTVGVGKTADLGPG